MQILAYTNLYPPACNAGAQTMLRDLLRPLVAAGHTVNVVIQYAKDHDKPYTWEGIDCFPAVDKRVLLHHVPRADLVITHLESTERVALLAKQWGKPVVQIIHNTMKQTHGYVGYKCDLAVFNSHWVSREYPEYRGQRMVVHPPVDPGDYQVSTPRPWNRKYVTLVNLWPNKGSDIFYKLAEQMPDVSFLGVLGGYGDQVVRVMPNVRFHNHTEDINEVYAQTKVILMPSVYESYGRVAVEAAASGIPSIVHPTPGLQEALGPAAIYADRGHIREWVEAVRKLLDPKAHRAASAEARIRSHQLWGDTERELAEWVEAIARFKEERWRLSTLPTSKPH